MRFIKFCVVGASGVAVNEGVLFLLTERLELFYLASSALAIEVSVITNFFLNDQWTFSKERHRSKKSLLVRFLKWNTARLTTIFLNMTVLWFLTETGLHYLVSNLVGIAVGTGIGYALSLKWVWRH